MLFGRFKWRYGLIVLRCRLGFFDKSLEFPDKSPLLLFLVSLLNFDFW